MCDAIDPVQRRATNRKVVSNDREPARPHDIGCTYCQFGLKSSENEHKDYRFIHDETECFRKVTEMRPPNRRHNRINTKIGLDYFKTANSKQRTRIGIICFV